MRIAVISDVHGNMPALKAVIEDSQKRNVNKYIFCGDYYMCMPYPNECIDLIKGIQNAIVIMGNNEPFLEALSKQDSKTWIDEQFTALYWYYSNIRQENLDYLMSLQRKTEIYDNNIKFVIAHSSKDIFGSSILDEISGTELARIQQQNPITKDIFLKNKVNCIINDISLNNLLNIFDDGIYVFGHTHIQWHLNINNKVLINPGSCGFPLDNNIKASYSVIDYGGNGIYVEEVRVDYDIEKLVLDFKSSNLYERAKIWNDIVIKSLCTSNELIPFFLKFADEYATKINDNRRPFMKDTWEEAYIHWCRN